MKRILLVLLLLALSASAYGVHRYFTFGRVSTDDAYVNADVAQIAALVTGPVVKVYVQNDQLVKTGDPLFDIDPKPFQVAVDKAKANLALAERGARQDDADIDAARADLAREKATLENDEQQSKRAQDLVAKHFLSRQAADDAIAKVRTQRAAVAAAEARLERARAKASGSIDESPDVRAARAELEQAELDLARTHVVAPGNGWISNLTLVAGTSVAANQPLFALVQQGSFRVDANFKETQLAGLHVGEKAEVEVDMYPDRTFHGVVQSLSPGTGTAFSLLPPQNATGNWVKVTQRVPVRIEVTDADPGYPLRIGATASVTVHLD